MVVKSIESKEDFNKIISGSDDKLIVIDFFATWCGPCVRIGPKIEAFSEKYTEVIFIKVDVDQLSDVAHESGISAMPTFHLMKNGSKVDELVGADESALEDLIKKNI